MTSLRYSSNLTDSAPQQSVWVFGRNAEDQTKQQQQMAAAAANNTSGQKTNKIKKNKNRATIAMATKNNSNSTQMPNSALLKYPMSLSSDPTHQNFIPIHQGEVVPYAHAANALHNIQQVPLVMNNPQVPVDMAHSKNYPQIHTNLISAIQNNDIIMLNNSMNILLSSYTQEINEAEWKDTIEVLNSFYMLLMSCDFLQKLYANGFNRIFVWPIESVISYLNPFEKDSEVFATLFIWLMNKHSLKPSQTIITFLMQTFFNSKNVSFLHSTLQLINKYDPNYELPAYIYNFMIANYQSESGN